MAYGTPHSVKPAVVASHILNLSLSTMASSCTNTHLDQPVYDSPLAVDHHTLQPRGFAPGEMCRRYKQYGLQSRDYMLGPMPPDQFLDEFLPVSSSEDTREMTSSRYAFRSVPRTAATPAEIHEPLV